MIVVLLDRDGVINRNLDDYVKTDREFEFLPGALEGLKKLRAAGISVVVISNQAGVGRGLIQESDLARINDKMLRGIEEYGGEIAAVYYCTHRKEERCTCRKPEIGLILRAAQEIGFEPANTFLVGDAEADIEAGRRWGSRTAAVLSGKSSAEDVEHWRAKPDCIAANLLEAVEWIISQTPDSDLAAE